MSDPRPRIVRFEKLPRGVKFVRVLPGGRSGDACLVECSHPADLRSTYSAGARRGMEHCGLCMADDLTRSCFTIAQVAEGARKIGTQRQGALF